MVPSLSYFFLVLSISTKQSTPFETPFLLPLKFYQKCRIHLDIHNRPTSYLRDKRCFYRLLYSILYNKLNYTRVFIDRYL